ncbi:YajQ family cyclic di-GMP-binding protein [Kiloniella laminariae]|uniref:Nucleotide-binding protein O4H49_19870 n=1 Tax=Kiloniella laminariae TaxID=454162 RepID=A0ABT4LPN5_9PROT|nr:YajQ family cyclic di-GMP-binding protein [Kiloniella laminariae]MCZ4283052.1 YajQ family cyclic di-GMP-binding protein [Kiloniella laminariae]
MPSFDIVSKTDMPEVNNALDGVRREVGTRYDFKGSSCEITLQDEVITILADDDLKLQQMHELLKGHLTRRSVDAAALDYGKAQPASGNKVRQTITIKQGIDRELAKTITTAIKQGKLKVQASIQGDEVRVNGKKRDDLQEAIAMLKGMDIEQPLQFVNFRD